MATTEQLLGARRAIIQHIDLVRFYLGGIIVYLEERAREYDLQTRIMLGKAILALQRRSQYHDRSKLSPPEDEVFAAYQGQLYTASYGSEGYNGLREQLKPALDHHYQVNRHHPEHFSNGIWGMNLVDLLEMICDWMASAACHSDGDIERSLEINRERFDYDEEVLTVFCNTVRFLRHAPWESLTSVQYKPGWFEGLSAERLSLIDWLEWICFFLAARENEEPGRLAAGLDSQQGKFGFNNIIKCFLMNTVELLKKDEFEGE